MRQPAQQTRQNGKLFPCLWLLLLITVSCSTSRKNLLPPVTIPAKFPSAGDARLPDKWWQSFHDPVLDGLIERALADNFNLRIVWDRLSQAAAVARKSGAARWPAVDGTAGASWYKQEGSDWTTFSLGAVASYELDLWGRVRSTRDAAALDLRATEQQVRSAAITLAAEVAATWYALVEQYGQIRLLREQLKTNSNVLELIMLRFRRGQVGAADVLRQRQLVETRQGEIATAESRAAVLAHQLAILLGQSPATPVTDRVETLPVLPPLPAVGMPAELVQRRPDIRVAYLNVLAADRRVAAAVADRFPRITLTAEVNTSSEKIRDLFDNWLASLAANVVAPLFDAGERSAEVTRTRAVVSERLNEYGQTILLALGEVEDALVQEQKQEELIASLQKQLTLSAQIIERIRDSYTNGAVDYLRVLDALSTHQAQQRDYLQARRQLWVYRINLCRALGGGWEMKAPPPAQVRQTRD